MIATETRAVVIAAVLASGTVMAHQLAAKAAREALFFSQFPARELPGMTIVAAVFSIAAVVASGRAVMRLGPAEVIPRIFWVSGLLHLVEWALIGRFPRSVAVAFYLHFTLGATLMSAFWLILSERFDPHTAKRQMSRIVAAGAIGALIGGLLTERCAAFGVPVLPVLAGLHGASGCLLLIVGQARGQRTSWPAPTVAGGLALLSRSAYLRQLMAVVFLCAAGAMLIDQTFRARVQLTTSREQDLQRFYSVFYMSVSALSILVHAGLTGRLLARFGLGATAGTLPAAVVAGGVGAALWPGIAGVSAARGAEAVIRSSAFRSAYELFYSPMPPHEKRIAKPVIDVGAERLGDIAGGAVMACLLAVGHDNAYTAGILLAAAAGLFAIWIAMRLNRGYVFALERGLRARAVELDLSDVKDKTTRSVVMRTTTTVPLKVPRMEPQPAAPDARDPLLRRIADLRSGETSRVRHALSEGPLNAALIAHIIPLLGWDDVARDAGRALTRAAGIAVGQLVDNLLDPEQEFAVRRRIPPILAGAMQVRAIEGLVLGLEDQRFEVRYRCGKALWKLVQDDPALKLPADRVFVTVAKELQLDRKLRATHRLLDGCEEAEMLAELADTGLDHVFTLLSLVLPCKPLGIAFRALHTDDALLRGTAIEYLAGVLPKNVQEQLWPLLDAPAPASAKQRPHEAVLAELLRSNESVEIRIADLKAKRAHAG